jgi:hypothetical protein
MEGFEKTPPSADPPKHPTLTSSPLLSLSFSGKKEKKNLKENQWWVGKWVGWVRAWAEPATHIGCQGLPLRGDLSYENKAL